MTQEQLELPIPSKAAHEFSVNWAKYRDGQRSMLSSIVAYIETQGHELLAKRVKEKFSGDS